MATWTSKTDYTDKVLAADFNALQTLKADIKKVTAANLGILDTGELGLETDTRRVLIGASMGNQVIGGDYITPEMFGAKGDGVHDDTAEIQAAIDAMTTTDTAHTTWGYPRHVGKHLVFSKGVYKVTSQITVGVSNGLAGFSISGAGDGSSIIIAGGAFAADTAVFKFKWAKSFTMDNLTIDANDNAQYALWLNTPTPMTYRTAQGVITNCTFCNSTVENVRMGDVFGADPGSDVSTITFINPVFWDAPIHIGLHSNNVLVNAIIQGIWGGTFNTGIWVQQGGLHVIGGQMVGSAVQDVLIGGGCTVVLDDLYSEQSTGHFLTAGTGTQNRKTTLNRIQFVSNPPDGIAILWDTNAPLRVNDSYFYGGKAQINDGADSIFTNTTFELEMAAGNTGYNDNEAQFNYWHRASIWDRNGFFNTRRYCGNPIGISDTTVGVDARDSNVFIHALVAHVTVALPINAKDGQTITYIFKQTGGGGWNVSWNAGFVMDPWSNAGNVLGERRAISFYYNVNTWEQIGSFQKNKTLGLSELSDPGADRLPFWDETAQELATNVGFDSDTTGWGVSNCTIASVAGGQAGNCLEITRVSGTYQYSVQEIVGLTIGSSYTFTGYVKSGTSGNEPFILRAYKSPDYGHLFQTTGISSGSWTQYTLTFTALATAYYFMLYKYSATPGTMLFDTVSVKSSANTLNWLSCGNSVAITENTLDTIQDIRTTASPSFSAVKVSAVQVVGAQGAAVADATDAASVITQLNLLLARQRAHGLIAT